MDTIPSPEAAAAESGLEAEGREVERVTLALERSSAWTIPVEK